MNTPELTAKQMEVIRLAAEGMGLKESARALGISVDTVKDRRTLAVRKLSCKNITHAVHVAHVQGLIGGAA